MTTIRFAAPIAALFLCGPVQSADVLTEGPWPAACAGLVLQESHGIRLAIRAQEGEAAFMRYVQFKRPVLGWTAEEAIERAKAAVDTPCGRAMGLRPLEVVMLPQRPQAHPPLEQTAGR